jgi:hypothetical protein
MGHSKVVLRVKFIAISADIKRTERHVINDLMLHLQLLEKQEQEKLKSSRRKEIIKIKVKIYEIETDKTIQRINETKSWFFEKLNKIEKPLTNLSKMRSEKRNEKGERKINTKEIQRLIRNYFENLYPNKLENPEEVDKFLVTNDH